MGYETRERLRLIQVKISQCNELERSYSVEFLLDIK